MAFSNIKALFFDLDGTLVDTMHGFADIAAQVIHDRYGWDIAKAKQAYFDTSGAPFFQQLEMLFPGHELNDQAQQEFETKKESVFFKATIKPETIQALKTLKDKGLNLAVSSNNREELVTAMIEREAPAVFDAICGFRTGFAKGPQHFEWLCEHFKIRLSDVVFVGDSLSDLKKAQASGMRFVCVLGTFTRQEFLDLDNEVTLVESLQDLPSVVV